MSQIVLSKALEDLYPRVLWVDRYFWCCVASWRQSRNGSGGNSFGGVRFLHLGLNCPEDRDCQGTELLVGIKAVGKKDRESKSHSILEIMDFGGDYWWGKVL
jgi:hypothetical protein